MILRYTPEAIHDLQALRDYIGKTLRNPKAAARITQRILNDCGQLKHHPMLGISLEAKTGIPSDLRCLICEKWLAFYRVEGDSVSVARILDGRQDYLQILFGKEME